MPAKLPLNRWMEITPRGIRRQRLSLAEHLSALWAQTDAVMFLIRHNLRQNTLGTVLGDLWMIIDPLLQAALYYFLIVVLFGVTGNDVVFVKIMVAVTFWRLHSKMLEGATTLFASRAEVIRQSGLSLNVIFFEFIGTRLGFFMFSVLTLLGVLLIGGHFPTLAWLWLIPVVLAQLLFSAALSVPLAGMCAAVRDLAPIVNVLVSIWWYVSPGLYSLDRIPERFRPLFELNPFAHILPAYQDIIATGGTPNLLALTIIIVCSTVFLALNLMYVVRIQHVFNRYL